MSSIIAVICDNLVFHDQQYCQIGWSRIGFWLSPFVGVNNLLKFLHSSKGQLSQITLIYKILIVIILENCFLYLSDLTHLADLLIVKNPNGFDASTGQFTDCYRNAKKKQISSPFQRHSKIYLQVHFICTFSTMMTRHSQSQKMSSI